ncbi:MAG: amidohydrolase [Chthoniobacter sp.]|uniref:amidohydrolase n=1 Tax=Chthoniobacter sp. TaxID=2510640 RepID=UPI0032A72D0E
MKTRFLHLAFTVVALTLRAADAPDLIVHHGKIVSVDDRFSIQEAMAMHEGRIVALGSNDDILKTKTAETRVIDLGGKTVLPGLIDSHTHPTGAAMTELEHSIPDFETVADVLEYVKARAQAQPAGEWIVLSQVFITRLREQRYPTRAELDQAAPKHPVLYRTGPDASLNSLALSLSGIDRNFKITDGSAGFAEMDPVTGEPTGILRNCTRYVKVKPVDTVPSPADRLQRLSLLFHDYNSVGLTSIADRDSSAAAISLYTTLRDRGELTLRVSISHGVSTGGPIEEVQKRIRAVAAHPLFKDKSGLVRIVGTKIYLDGGMLTGSAYMRDPWGESKIYAITDPTYRGVLFVPPERLVPMVRTAVESNLQFTAHSVGDGAVHTLLDAYETVGKEMPIRQTRPCITHANFQSRAAIDQAARLGVVMDIQPAWLYLDTRTLSAQFGNARLRWFQPLHSLFAAGVIVGGGSDHMQKIGSLRAINPYNPFLGMATAITRRAKWFEGQLHPEEALTREEAIRFYTRNNAWLLFDENKVGSLEAGKRADFIVLDRDILTCPENDIRNIEVLATYMDGKQVYARK